MFPAALSTELGNETNLVHIGWWTDSESVIHLHNGTGKYYTEEGNRFIKSDTTYSFSNVGYDFKLETLFLYL